jgi:hypothetical protein
MAMAVSDQQVATLRAFLEGDKPKYNDLLADLDRHNDGLGYSALVTAAFFEAVDRRFSVQSPQADVVDYVANVRSRSSNAAEDVDPRIAERLIREVLGDGSTSDVDSSTSTSTKLYLLTALLVDARLDPEGLDQFIGKVKKMADHMLSRPN